MDTCCSVSADTDAGHSDTNLPPVIRSNAGTTARANRNISTSGVQKARGFGRGQGKHSPAQGGIDTMFRAQQPSIQLPQTDNTGMTEREGVNDSGSGTCYDDAADNDIKENGRPHETQTH